MFFYNIREKCHKNVPSMCYKCAKYVLQMCQVCATNVLQMLIYFLEDFSLNYYKKTL